MALFLQRKMTLLIAASVVALLFVRSHLSSSTLADDPSVVMLDLAAAAVPQSHSFFSSQKKKGLEVQDLPPGTRIETDQLLQMFGIQPRAWSAWDPNIRLPCYEGDIDTLAQKGFLFVKPKKCGSTTGSSITVRIAHNIAKKFGYKMCQCWTDHIPAYNLLGNKKRRNRQKSFLWSVVRDPTTRLTSEFFHFHVTREGKPSSDATFMEFLQDRRSYENFFIRYLQSLQRRWNPLGDIVGTMNHILDSYDFIAVTERMDESAVALQLLLGLETSDVLYISSKTSGDYDDGRWNDKCYLIQKSFVSPGMEEYFASAQFKASIYWDELFYQVINSSLDMTIAAIGKETFEKELTKFRAVKAAIHGQCAASVRLPCTDAGVKRNETDCLKWDIACGFECMESSLESVLQELKENENNNDEGRQTAAGAETRR